MSDPQTSVGKISGAAGIVALALSLTVVGGSASANAQTPHGPDIPEKETAAPVVQVRDSIGSRPDFFVPWIANAPGLTAKPALKRGSQPKYPPASVRAKEAGSSTLEFCITAEGQPTDIRLVASSGFARLDEAVLAWAPTAAYSPARFQGSPLAICGFQLTYEWRIAP